MDTTIEPCVTLEQMRAEDAKRVLLGEAPHHSCNVSRCLRCQTEIGLMECNDNAGLCDPCAREVGVQC